ncbi:MAG TPA: hypothetical protein GXX47_09280 [Firmicutes bacterium]|nr:hypothetical protein [Bacillota bacterium]
MQRCLSPMLKGEAAALMPAVVAGLGLALIKITSIDTLYSASFGASLHILVRVLGVHTAFLLFFLGWSAGIRRQTLQGLTLTVASLSLGLLNVFHLLSLPMVPYLLSPNSFNKAALFAALTSVLVPSLILAISFLPVRRINRSMRRLLLGTGLLFTGVCAAAVLFYEQYLPRFFIGDEPVGRTSFYLGIAACCLSLVSGLRYAGIYSRTGSRLHRQVVIIAAVWALSQAGLLFFDHQRQFGSLVTNVYQLLVLGYIYDGLAVPFGRRPYLSLDRAQIHLRQTRRQRTLGRLMRYLAHELKNPLAAIRASAQLSAILDDSKERAQVTGRIEAEVDRLAELVSITLEAGWDRPEMWEPINVGVLVEELVSSWAPEFTRRGIESRVCAEPIIPPVGGNIKLLNRALRSLIANALDAMPDGGKLTICLIYEKPLRQVRLEIADTGPGIPEEIRNRIFQEMVTTKPRGTGLGLLITSQIISELHHGEIWFETTPGQGTTFFVRLPVYRGKNLSDPVESPVSPLRQNTVRLWDEEEVEK